MPTGRRLRYRQAEQKEGSDTLYHTEASGSRAAAISYVLRPSRVRCVSSIAEFDSPKPLLIHGELIFIS